MSDQLTRWLVGITDPDDAEEALGHLERLRSVADHTMAREQSRHAAAGGRQPVVAAAQANDASREIDGLITRVRALRDQRDAARKASAAAGGDAF